MNEKSNKMIDKATQINFAVTNVMEDNKVN